MGLTQLAWRYRVRFATDSGVREYLSPDVRGADPGWRNEVFTHPIDTIEFFLPTGHVIRMAGMQSYNFLVEAEQDLGAGGRIHIRAFWLLGHLPGCNRVERWRIGDGKIVRDRQVFEREWAGKPTSGWKQGSVDVLFSSGVTNGWDR